MTQIRRHKVFVSYHHENDQAYRDRFERLFADVYDIMDSRSVRIGDIPRETNTAEVSRRIRDEYLKDATVTVVLIGTDTWRRKHIDWEIAGSIRDTNTNPRSGLLGIFLPAHTAYEEEEYDPYTTPPRLYYNVECGFAELQNWSESPGEVAGWIHEAFNRRRKVDPDNSSVRFARNWRGDRWYPQKRTGAG